MENKDNKAAVVQMTGDIVVFSTFALMFKVYALCS